MFVCVILVFGFVFFMVLELLCGIVLVGDVLYLEEVLLFEEFVVWVGDVDFFVVFEVFFVDDLNVLVLVCLCFESFEMFV